MNVSCLLATTQTYKFSFFFFSRTIILKNKYSIPATVRASLIVFHSRKIFFTITFILNYRT